ncbi:unnamed protein product [Hyaloperonospora brassicae]|uniref:RxLR effector candidate protein n=1 Tax=Hyaloperonospora brassicae TaxID=162125 RepID=A0AAV0TME6_HYABA|nr:unnamed protein product [Hyaloperonospora brassicae]
MRIHGLLYLVFFVVNGVLTHAAALDSSDAHRPETSAPTAGEVSKTDDAAVYKRALNDRSKEERGPVLDSLFGPLKRGFQRLLDKFRSRRPHEQPIKPIEDPMSPPYVSTTGPPWDSEVNAMLSSKKVGPKKAFDMLKKEDDLAIKWLGYVVRHDLDSTRRSEEKISNEDVVLLLSKSGETEASLAGVFAKLMAAPFYKSRIQEIQTLRFKYFLSKKPPMVPSAFERLLLPDGGTIAGLPIAHPLSRAHKAFSLEYAESQGSPAFMKKLTSLYSMGDSAGVAKYLAEIENLPTNRLRRAE